MFIVINSQISDFDGNRTDIFGERSYSITQLKCVPRENEGKQATHLQPAVVHFSARCYRTRLLTFDLLFMSVLTFKDLFFSKVEYFQKG